MSHNNLGSARILFLIGCWEGESKRYRVYNLIEGLGLIGVRAAALDFAKCGEIVDQALRPDVVVFYRSPFHPAMRVVEVLEYCRVNHIQTVFDIDDYVFEPSIVDQVAGVSELTAEQKANYIWGVRAYRSLLFSCDKATTTTTVLQERMRDLGREAHVVPNSVNAAQLEAADQLLGTAAAADGHVRICYFSGSKTHARDFAQCASAIQEIMRANHAVRFRLVGLLDLDMSWTEFADRIERFGLMSPQEMLSHLHQCDINLAPLEEGDAFCEGKSELKFFEAALVHCPTVASRTAPFVAAIKDGENGMLASSPEEWRQKLNALCDDATLRKRLGSAARKTALACFSTLVAARAAMAAYGLPLPVSRAKASPKEKRTIGWILPGLIIGGGGHRNILRAAYHLERFGHDVRLYFSDTELGADELKNQVREHFYPFDGEVRRFDGRVGGEDMLLATHWSTVALAQSVRSAVGEIAYFVQDFEPAFYPMGSEYLLAENTYRMGLYAITSGPWCADLLRSSYGMEADSFRFPVDKGIYRPDAGRGAPREKRVLFFAKPEMPRRCFLIGAMALQEFHRLRPEYEILFFGSGSARSHPQPYPVTYLDVVPTLAQLAGLYATSTCGLVFSTTNPSLVPYEMMACGLPVIDVDRPGNELNYDGRRDIALLANPDPVRMAREMVANIEQKDEWEARAAASIAFAATFPSEDEMAREIERLILARVTRGRAISEA